MTQCKLLRPDLESAYHKLMSPYPLLMCVSCAWADRVATVSNDTSPFLTGRTGWKG